MYIKTNDYEKDGVPLHATNLDLEERWTALSPKQVTEWTGDNFKWFYGIKSKRATKLHLVYDLVVDRPAIAKTILYRPEDLQSPQTVATRRKVLIEQIRILNDLSSPLLPEPLDWFQTRNTVDGLDASLQDSEPVLILDYQPGQPLDRYIGKMRFRDNNVHRPRIARLALKLLEFLRVLDDNGYGYLDMNIQHILLLKNDIPRFVGLGSICPINEKGYLDSSHINFWSTSKGYAAPELLDPTNDWEQAKKATPAQVGAFSLGVVIHQMFAEKKNFERTWLHKGSFVYPNGETESIIQNQQMGDLIHQLIAALCEHDPNKRLTDFDEIEERIVAIENSVEAVMKRHRDRKYRRQYENRGSNGTNRNGSGDRKFFNDLDELKRRRAEEESRERLRKKMEEQRRKREEEMRRRMEAERRRREEEQRKKRKEWCFLSTAAYGTSTHEHLDTLRWFRDKVLRPKKWGRNLLASYARKSPAIADRLEVLPVRKGIIRSLINVAVKAVEKVQRYRGTDLRYYIWTGISIAIYYSAFGLARIFVLPDKLSEKWKGEK